MRATNIIVSGLSASAKTPHAKLLAAELKYEYVSATELMADMVGLGRAAVNSSFWHQHGPAIRLARERKALDQRLDATLKSMAARRRRLVFDAWALPWLIPSGACISIWLESDIDSRAMRATAFDNNRHSVEWYARFIREKDEEARYKFMTLYGFDLLGDHSHFTIELNNSSYVSEATIADVNVGVQHFHPILMAAVHAQFATV